MAAAELPIVDFSAFVSVDVPTPGQPFEPTQAQLDAARPLLQALTTHGFIYAKGLLDPAAVDAAFAASRQLYDPSTDRAALHPLGPETNIGYGGMGSESLNARRAADQKEVFNVRAAALTEGSPLLDGTPAGFREEVAALWAACAHGAQRALLAFGVALGLDNPAKFAQSLQTWDTTTLRLLHYPELPAMPDAEQDGSAPISCGEHTDFGAVTVLLLEDGAAGLEVRRPGGEGGWIPATGMAGTVLLNTGALLARWCNDHVKATPHRVVLATPAERYSIAFFVDPDAAEVVEVLPEFVRDAHPAKYPAITAAAYIEQCLRGTMQGQVSEEARRSLVID